MPQGIVRRAFRSSFENRPEDCIVSSTKSFTRSVSPIAAQRIASGVKISKSSKIGEFSYGFASQKFSGGGTTRDLLYGMEFGSNRFKQFPNRTPVKGRGNSGYFIYSTLREIQPELVTQWEAAFDRILKEYD